LKKIIRRKTVHRKRKDGCSTCKAIKRGWVWGTKSSTKDVNSSLPPTPTFTLQHPPFNHDENNFQPHLDHIQHYQHAYLEKDVIKQNHQNAPPRDDLQQHPQQQQQQHVSFTDHPMSMSDPDMQSKMAASQGYGIWVLVNAAEVAAASTQFSGAMAPPAADSYSPSVSAANTSTAASRSLRQHPQCVLNLSDPSVVVAPSLEKGTMPIKRRESFTLDAIMSRRPSIGGVESTPLDPSLIQTVMPRCSSIGGT
jgi:hypothetical protein